jgi:ubiquinone/menaquinone biosynthesis C-methylase UbiE
MRNSYKDISINTAKNTHETVFKMVNKNKNAKIVDIPSGAGAFICRLKDNGYDNILAIDIENSMKIDHEEFSIGDMTETLPIGGNSIDTLVCIDGIEHIARQEDFVKEVHRILTKGGEFIVSTPNISSLRSRWRWFLTGHHNKCKSPLDEKNPTPMHHIGMMSLHEIRYMLHVNGFEIIEVATNRVKFINYVYAFWLPLIYLITSGVYLKSGKKEGTSKVNAEVKKMMFSKSVLFGEVLILKAMKK